MSQGHAIFHPLRMPIAENLRSRAKGYSGAFRELLENAAYTIEQYQTEKPFEACIQEYAFLFTGIGFEEAAWIADSMNAPEVAAAIRAEYEKQMSLESEES